MDILTRTKIFRRPLTYISLAGVLLLLIGGSVFLLLNKNSSAAPVTGFKAGRIIDDSVFTNKTTMPVSAIQSFLNSKVPTCDTYGTQLSEFGGGTRAQWAAARGYSPPFTCLKDFEENGKKSAQIIYDISQKYSINPQVLIVLLQKEQGLVTDTWPIPGSAQYRTATGYGCPDTAPCDTQYYGLTNQLDWAAKMFRAIMNQSPTWYTPYILGDNYIQYNPVASCGGTVVNIENRATQALYNYTPYQPNQGALSAGWGQATCGAYGNRNFYLYFTDWFGPTNKPAIPDCSVTNVNCVWELRNEDTGKYFYTASKIERDEVYKQNYTYIGVAFYSRKSSVESSKIVYRLLNPVGLEHIWVTQGNELNHLVNSGWVNEGQAYIMDASTANTGAAVSRLYNSSTGTRVYSTNSITTANLLKTGYSRETSNFKSPTSTGIEPTPGIDQLNVYRFLKSDGQHFWTTSEGEKNNLIKNKTYSYEGSSWEANITKLGGTPVYRVYSPTGKHFWTTSEGEKNNLISLGWRNEGIAWYETTSGTDDIYRIYNSKTGAHLFTSSKNEKGILLNTGWSLEGISWKG